MTRSHANREQVRRNPPWAGLVALEGTIACAAWSGGIGLLADNAIGLSAQWIDALPFRSAALAGVALLLVVAAPFTTALIAEAARFVYAYSISLLASALLVGWIFVQWALVREYFVLQPVMLAAALATGILAWWVHGPANQAN